MAVGTLFIRMMSAGFISRVEIAATAVIRDEKDFHGRAARKAAGIFREEGRADLHAVASLNKGRTH
jgi:hypothetical protein